MRRLEHRWKARLLTCTIAAAVAVAGALTLTALHAGAQDASQSGAQTAFEVASVKLHVASSGGVHSSPGRFVLRSISLTGLIMRAYGLQVDRQLVRPDWSQSVFLDIDAKMPEGAAKEQIPRMLQTLLADRLKLAVHEESRIMPVYTLTVGKAGPKTKEVPASKFIDEILRPRPQGFRGHFTMPLLAYLLSESLDRYVLDSTGLKAIYDVDLRWTPDEASPPTGAGGARQPLPVASDWPNLFQAVQQQLGLNLESGRAPVKVIVVDHVERIPTAN